MASAGAGVGPVRVGADVGDGGVMGSMTSGKIVDPRSWIPHSWLSGLTFALALLSIPILVFVVLMYNRMPRS
jgi:hypothetical protein